MIPRTFPSSVAFNGSAQMIVYFLPSVAGLTRWVDYIPVKFTTADSDAKENTYNQDGYIPVLSIPSIAGLTPFKEYVPVFLDSFAADADVWDVNITGFIPVGTSGVGGAALYLDFAASQFLDPRITFTRASTATYFNSAGVLTTTGFNLLTYSTDLSTGWTKGSAATWTANAATAPDGTMTALGVNGLSGTGRLNTGTTLYTSTLSATGSTAYTLTVYVRAKSGTASNVCLRLQETGGNNTVSPGNTVGETWQRISLSITTAAGATAVSVTIGTTTGTANLYIWGAQLETGPVATAYVPTGATNTSSAPRFDYDSATLAPRGLLLEEQRTNLLTYSEQFDNAAWTKTRSSVTANTIVSPDGTADADKLVEDTTASSTHFVSQTNSFTSGLAYSFTTYAKAAEKNFIRLSFPTAAFGATIGATFNLTNSATSSVSSGVTATSNFVGNGWYRVQIVATATATASSGAILFLMSADGTTASYTGDGTSGIFIYGSQLEAGAFATSYIPTVASQVTRAADVAVMTGTNFSSWFNATEGTFYLDADMYAAQHGFFRHFLSANTGSGVTSDFIGISNPANSNNAAARVTTANVAQCSMQTAITLDKGFRTAFAYKTNNSAVSYDGATSLTDNSVTLPTGIDQLYIGGVSSAGANAATHIRKITYYPRRLSNAQLQGITA